MSPARMRRAELTRAQEENAPPRSQSDLCRVGLYGTRVKCGFDSGHDGGCSWANHPTHVQRLHEQGILTDAPVAPVQTRVVTPTRSHGLTRSELDARIASLTPEERASYEAHRPVALRRPIDLPLVSIPSPSAPTSEDAMTTHSTHDVVLTPDDERTITMLGIDREAFIETRRREMEAAAELMTETLSASTPRATRPLPSSSVPVTLSPTDEKTIRTHGLDRDAFIASRRRELEEAAQYTDE